MSSSRRLANPPVDKYFPSDSLVVGAGVVIFHLATDRVVVCKDTRNDVWFLPKGRRDASEETSVTAIREGFEESGYRNRLLPLPLPHIQPRPLAEKQAFDTEPVATRMLPVAKHYQYLLFWYAAETLPADVEEALNTLQPPLTSSLPHADTKVGGEGEGFEGFVSPPMFPDITLEQRRQQDILMDHEGREKVYEPKRHEGTGVDDDEAFYIGVLMGVDDAIKVLGGTSADVVKRAWEGVCLRRNMEEKELRG